MNMHIARLTEQIILEVVMFQVGEGMGHVVLARNERLFPHDFVTAPYARRAAHVLRQFASQDFDAERSRAQLGVGQPQIILLFGNMV